MPNYDISENGSKFRKIPSFEKMQMLRGEYPEMMAGIRQVICDPRVDGTTAGMISIDGYYKVKDSNLEIRQVRVYDVRTNEEAINRAKQDGLVMPLVLEFLLDEPTPCTLGIKSGSAHNLTEAELKKIIGISSAPFKLA